MIKKILTILISLWILLGSTLHAEEWCDVECAEVNSGYALLSKEIYNDKSVVGEWTRIEDYTKTFLGLYTHGLHLSVYQNSQTDKLAIVIEGTDATDIEDLLTDIVQLTSTYVVPQEYTEARDYVVSLIEENYEYRDAVIMGHSLGGGIAQYVAWSLGLEAHTFNPAGLSDSTVDDAEEFFTVNGDGLRRDVTHIISNNNRGQRDVVSSYGQLLGVQKFLYVDKDNLIDLHSINYLYEALLNAIEGD